MHTRLKRAVVASAVLVAALGAGAGQLAWASGPKAASNRLDELSAKRPAAASSLAVRAPYGVAQAVNEGTAGAVWTEAYNRYVLEQVQAAQAAAEAQAAADAQAAAEAQSRPASPRASGGYTGGNRAVSQGGSSGGRCGESCIIARESGGNPNAMNASGAGGLYQFMPSTWAGYGGYASAADAPPSVQQQRFDQVWAGGAGCANWNAC